MTSEHNLTSIVSAESNTINAQDRSGMGLVDIFGIAAVAFSRFCLPVRKQRKSVVLLVPVSEKRLPSQNCSFFSF